jgi:uncharacterized protein YndB with AHSA1/START domain
LNSYTFVHEIPADPSVVWEIVADHPGMSRWTPIRRVEMEAGGRPEPHGVGAVRALHLVGPPIREEVTAFEPNRRLAYRMLSGAPVRDYTGEIVLEPAARGTRMTWTIRFTPQIPGVQFGVAGFIRYTAAALAREGGRRGTRATS